MFECRQVPIARVSALLVVSLALAFTVGCSRDPNVRKQKYLESGKRYEDNGKYKEAAIQFSNALKVDNHYAAAHYELAKTYMKLGSMMPAYTELLRAVDLDPNNLEARITFGNMLLAGHATDRAEAQAKAVLALNPNYADGYALLAGVAQRRGDSAEAIKDIQHALSIDPNHAAYHSALALMESGNPANEADAEQELRKAASLDSKSPTPHLLLAGMLERKNDLTGAEQEFQAAISAAPKDLQAREALAALYLHAGNKAKAEETLHQAVVDMPDNQSASSVLAEYYNRSGQLEHAESVFADLDSKFPKSFAIRLTYGRILFDRKNYAKATAVAAQLNKEDAGNPDVQTLNAILLLNTGKVDDAYALLKKAVKDNPNNVQTELLLARVAGAKGDVGAAETALRQVDKLSPGNLEAESGLASIAIGRADAGMLSEVADKTIKLHPDFASAYLWRGTAEASRKEFDKAEADYQLVLKTDPNNAVAYLELGVVKVAEGHVPEGKAMFEKALEKDPNSTRAMGMLLSYDIQAKQFPQAIQRVQVQIAKAPANSTYYTQLAILQMDTKDYKSALDSSRKAMQLNPASSDAAQAYSQAEAALGDLDPAIAVWQTWTTAHPNDAHGFDMLGVLEEAKNDQTKAMEFYKKALQIDTNDAVASNNLAYLMVENGQNVDVALSLAQTARRLKPNLPETADTLAWIYYAKGAYGTSRDLLESALKDSPDNASMHLHLGLADSKLNDKPDAVLQLKKAVTLGGQGKVGKEAAAELDKLK